MKARYNYRLYPSPGQKQALARAFGCARVVFNDALAAREQARREDQPFISDGDLMKRVITQAKQTPERAWLAEVPNVVLQQSVRDLFQAYRNFFKSLKGERKGAKMNPPRFKRRRSAQSIRFTRKDFKLRGPKVQLCKIGKIKIRWSRNLPSEPSSVTVKLDSAGRYFASFVCEVKPEPLPKNGKTVGVDLGLTTFATLSTGEKIDAPKPLKKSLKRLRHLQRVMSRCQKGVKGKGRSKRYDVMRKRVAKLHARIADIRTDFPHKLSTRLIRENQSVVVEDLNVLGMVKNRCLSRAISDMGWRQFRTLLGSKAQRYDREIVVVNRWEPTSQRCSSCGELGGKKPLNVRKWTCLHCGAEHDRDINAAVNIAAVVARNAETLNERGGGRKTTSVAASSEALTQGEVRQLRLFG